MATPSRVALSASEHPVFYIPPLREDSARKTSELLQENHEKYHVFFNWEGFHNHIVHHLLTVYALQATPDLIQKHYDNNKTYQRPAVPVHDFVLHEMRTPAMFRCYLGDEKYYHDFLVFFQQEMEKRGWQNVVNEYLFKGDERADDMMVRLFAGFLHPLIHLGFGIEFEQPAIVAEALAQTAVHDNWMAPLLLGAERKAAESKGHGKIKSLVEFLDAAHANEKRALDDVVDLASQWTVSEEELEVKTAEMINAAAYFSACAQRPPHEVKFDFYYMHCVNCSIFLSALRAQPWLPAASKVRLLEWKGRNDIAMYASRRTPALLLDEVRDYQRKRPGGWDELFERAMRVEDDGHAAKLVRALAHGAEVCGKWEGGERGDAFRIRGDMWVTVGHMAVDSVEEVGGEEAMWVRSCGFAEAWKDVPERGQARV